MKDHLLRLRTEPPSQSLYQWKAWRVSMLVLCMITPLLAHCASVGRTVSKQQSAVPVLFVFTDDQARKVCIAGSFNQWSPDRDCMEKVGGKWSLTINLAKGRHQYGFVIDDRTWKEDPQGIISEDSGFGSKNSVLIIE